MGVLLASRGSRKLLNILQCPEHSLHNKEWSGLKCNGAEAEKPCTGETKQLLIDTQLREGCLERFTSKERKTKQQLPTVQLPTFRQENEI